MRSLTTIRKKGKILIRRVINDYPSLKNWVRLRHFDLWKLSVKLRGYKYRFAVNKLHWIDPQKIKYRSLRVFDPYFDRGKVIGGNWDLLKEQIENQSGYKWFKERIIDGKDWRDTEFYSYVLHKIKSDGEFGDYRSKEDWAERIRRLERLYQDIKKNGYKSGRKIRSESNVTDPRIVEDEVTVNIGREGNLLFNDGLHRLYIAKLLKLRKIPVKIVVRHPKWFVFRLQLMGFVKDRGKLYHLLTHPDLEDIPAYYEQYRFNIIRRKMGLQRGSLLDIGAYLGYFCHRFEELGFDCYAVEPDVMCVYFLKKLKRAENRSFKVIPKSIFEYRKGKKIKFDVVLALNVLHHFLKKKDSFENLIKLLKRLETKEIYFQAHDPNEPQMKGAYRNYNPEEFVDFILRHSCLYKSEMIGMTKDKRSIYKIWSFESDS